MKLGQSGLITRIGQFASKKVQPGETGLYSFCWRFKCRKGIDKGRNVGRYPITLRPRRPTDYDHDDGLLQSGAPDKYRWPFYRGDPITPTKSYVR